MAEQAIAPPPAPATRSEGDIATAADPEHKDLRAPRARAGTARRPTRPSLPRLLVYAAAAVVVLYVLVFVRGLWWEWRGIITATNASVPVVDQAPRGASAAPASGAPAAPGLPAAAAQQGRKAPLPPTDEPPPRNATDKYGVTYDDRGVAVMGIDTDPSGVYNVPPGRQVRIGGPQGDLYDVTPDGKLVRATTVRDFPR